jgi:hypothetical protein
MDTEQRVRGLTLLSGRNEEGAAAAGVWNVPANHSEGVAS